MATSVSLIIPTCNMAGFLRPLWNSIRSSGLWNEADEILFVNDGSTDSTASELERLRSEEGGERISILSLHPNQGRFLARYRGAEAAKGDRVLFLDSRIVLPPDFGANFRLVAAQYDQVVGTVQIDTSRNVFCLYWDRSHRTIFRTHFRDSHRPIVLTPENYDRYLKGTTIFLCSKALFLEACSRFSESPLLNDDTFLMKEITWKSNLVIHPDLKISWVPRESVGEFLYRLWERGPSFVEYHVFERRGLFFWVVLSGLATLAGLAYLAVTRPALGLSAVATLLFLALASVAVFARTPLEALRMAPLHLSVILVFGAGVLRGLGVNLIKWIRRRKNFKSV